jgi:protein O-GlcNAc transferase
MNISNSVQAAIEDYQNGNLKEAESICREILRIRPDDIYVLNLLGNILRDKGDVDKATECYKAAIKRNTQYPGSYYNLAKILHSAGKLDEAISYYRKAIELDPDFPGSYFYLGNVYQEKGRLDEAIRCYRKAIELDPKFPGLYVNLGNVYQEKGRLDEAINSYEGALSVDPDSAAALHNLGNAYQEKGQFGVAISNYKRALQIDPARADTYSSLGNAYFNQGKLEEAEGCFRHALEIKPGFLYAYSYLLLLLNCSSRYSASDIYSEHRRFAEKLAEPLYPTICSYPNECVPERRLKVGYVSPDFKRHPVSFFIEPVLISHSRKEFEIFCYSNVEAEDEVTMRIKQYVKRWRNIVGLSDKDVAELISRDKIDILVDLAGHTLNNRVLLFARKPAPVQVSWIGYPATTGLSTMDYKIVDNYTDPPRVTEQFYTERLIRLPDCFLCYLPGEECPSIDRLPALSNGYITFGSFNNFAKMSPEVFACWIKILKSPADSRLILKARSFSDRTVRRSVESKFTKERISTDRIELFSWVPSMAEHLSLYNRIDIGLDTFPYNGTTTTCEAMWMGVPVITLSGNTHASRVGVSLLSNIGLSGLVAETPDDYVGCAVDLANDRERLCLMRERLRDMMLQSPLADAKRFIFNLEKCYRLIWENWCRFAPK